MTYRWKTWEALSHLGWRCVCVYLANERCRVRIGWMSPQGTLSLSVCHTRYHTADCYFRLHYTPLQHERDYSSIPKGTHGAAAAITFFCLCNRGDLWESTAVKQEMSSLLKLWDSVLLQLSSSHCLHITVCTIYRFLLLNYLLAWFVDKHYKMAKQSKLTTQDWERGQSLEVRIKQKLNVAAQCAFSSRCMKKCTHSFFFF